MFCQVELASRRNLQKISCLGPAISVADRRKSAYSQKGFFLCPAGFIGIAIITIHRLDCFTKRFVCCLMRLDECQQVAGRFPVPA